MSVSSENLLSAVVLEKGRQMVVISNPVSQRQVLRQEYRTSAAEVSPCTCSLCCCSVISWSRNSRKPHLWSLSWIFFSLSLPSYMNFKLNYAFYEETTLCIEAALLCVTRMSPHLGTTKPCFILNFSILLMIMRSPILLSFIPFLWLQGVAHAETVPYLSCVAIFPTFRDTLLTDEDKPEVLTELIWYRMCDGIILWWIFHVGSPCLF